MNLKLLPVLLFVSIAFAGCLKDSSQSVSHVNDVNVSLTGTWTQNNNTTNYYGADSTVVYTYRGPLVNFKFDGDKTVTETDTSSVIKTGSYTINTESEFDYINISGNSTGTHQYKIERLQSRSLGLSETLTSAAGIVINTGTHNVTYYKSVQVSNYSKNNLQ